MGPLDLLSGKTRRYGYQYVLETWLHILHSFDGESANSSFFGAVKAK